MGGAKVSSAASNHASATKYIAAELQKCSIGETQSMGTNFDCTVDAENEVSGAAASALADFKNPYESGEAAVENASGTDVGVTYIDDDGTTITITTKTKNSTESKFNLSNTVKVE